MEAIAIELGTEAVEASAEPEVDPISMDGVVDEADSGEGVMDSGVVASVIAESLAIDGGDDADEPVDVPAAEDALENSVEDGGIDGDIDCASDRGLVAGIGCGEGIGVEEDVMVMGEVAGEPDGLDSTPGINIEESALD